MVDQLEDISKQAPQRAFTELGDTGLKQFGGLIHEEFLRELQGDSGRRIYKEMSLNDSVIAGILFAIEMPIREVEWHFERESDNQADKDAEEFLEGAMDDMSLSWADFMTEALTMLTYGWSYFETVYKRRRGNNTRGASNLPTSRFNDGRIGWRKFALRAQDTLDRWEFDNNGGLQGMWQTTIDFQKVFIPIQKSLLFRTKTAKGNPEGQSVLRTSYRAWYFKKNLEMLEAIALERMGAGFPVIYLPENYTATDLSVAKSAVRKIRVDEQMGLTFPGPKQTPSNPNGWLFELTAPASSRGIGAGFEQAIARYRAEILISVVASFIALGTQQVGSFALSRDQRSFFQTAIEGWLSILSDTFDRFATPKLLELNGMNPTAPVHLTHTPVGQADLRTMGAFVQGLGQLGFLTPDAELEQFFRRAAGFPAKLQDDMEAAEEARRMVNDMNLKGPEKEIAEKILKALERRARVQQDLDEQSNPFLSGFNINLNPNLEDDDYD